MGAVRRMWRRRRSPLGGVVRVLGAGVCRACGAGVVGARGGRSCGLPVAGAVRPLWWRSRSAPLAAAPGSLVVELLAWWSCGAFLGGAAWSGSKILSRSMCSVRLEIALRTRHRCLSLDGWGDAWTPSRSRLETTSRRRSPERRRHRPARSGADRAHVLPVTSSSLPRFTRGRPERRRGLPRGGGSAGQPDGGLDRR